MITLSDLSQSYTEMARCFTETAKVWRKIAHDAAKADDQRCLRMAHKYALENEQWAREL